MDITLFMTIIDEDSSKLSKEEVGASYEKEAPRGPNPKGSLTPSGETTSTECE